MKKILIAIAALMLCVQGFAQKQKYVVGFYNLENLFDIYDDPAKNDEEFLPDGKTSGPRPSMRRSSTIWHTSSVR